MNYILTSNKLKGKILVGFTPEGVLCKMEVDPADATRKLMHWFLERLPLLEGAMHPKYYDNLLHIEPVSDDLSFDRFWNDYDQKVGKKARVEKLWDTLSNPDRAKALAGIRRYDNYLLKQKGIAKAYAETYLRNRYWENEY